MRRRKAGPGRLALVLGAAALLALLLARFGGQRGAAPAPAPVPAPAARAPAGAPGPVERGGRGPLPAVKVDRVESRRRSAVVPPPKAR